MIKTDLLAAVKNKKPVIHHITNFVTINDCANITLALGASPIMSNDVNEIEDIVKEADSLVLNMGTLSPIQFSAILKAGLIAQKSDIPIVLDPVGIGGASFRTEKILNLLEKVKPTVIKGNEAEISILSGEFAKLKGIESRSYNGDILENAKKVANKFSCIAVVTGKEDLVTDGLNSFVVSNGHYYLKDIIGSGCMAASMIACFLTVDSTPLGSSVTALKTYGIAAEIAGKRQDVKGPGSFKIALMDEIYNLTWEKLMNKAKVRQV
ncbi:MAG: hydroxyethylthiazole kinase [Bacillota bacterium]